MDSRKLLSLYKHSIQIKEYDPDVLTNYMYQHYNCEEITNDYKDTYHYQVLLESLNNYHNIARKQHPVFLKVINDEKSANLYKSEDFNNENFIYVFIDKVSGFFDTPSFDLAYELTLEKGVGQEDYDNETLVLLDALTSIDDYMHIHLIGCYKL